MLGKYTDDQWFLWKESQLKGEKDGRNVHILRYGEVILAYTWFNLNFRLTKTACWGRQQWEWDLTTGPPMGF